MAARRTAGPDGDPVPARRHLAHGWFTSLVDTYRRRPSEHRGSCTGGESGRSYTRLRMEQSTLVAEAFGTTGAHTTHRDAEARYGGRLVARRRCAGRAHVRRQHARALDGAVPPGRSEIPGLSRARSVPVWPDLLALSCSPPSRSVQQCRCHWLRRAGGARGISLCATVLALKRIRSARPTMRTSRFRWVEWRGTTARS